jgi:hypothetical protein
MIHIYKDLRRQKHSATRRVLKTRRACFKGFLINLYHNMLLNVIIILKKLYHGSDLLIVHYLLARGKCSTSVSKNKLHNLIT